MSTKQIVTQLAHRMGYEIVPAWRMRGLSFSRHLASLFEQYRVDTVIDVGANVGQYHDFIRAEVDFHGPILSYEPQPDCFGRLTERVTQDKHWQVRNLALGTEPGELSLNIMNDSQFSSFLAPEHGVIGDFVEMNQVRQVVKVPVARLDDDLSLPAVQSMTPGRLYLKLDTQGFDLAVLRGAMQTLTRTVALQTELSIKPVYQGMTDYRQMIDELENMGFELSSMFPISHDADLGLIEADGVFINRRALEMQRA
ncbi:FkbM family methyltransferase [Uliginosibacterium sp. H3]|uniref:FkbM family methyltransferase n=1 Tax=Uliginosibacterium silvisoli TaxID=3114758 RepID=A0ABU6K592_9RHOO|nr:FkbM family methyltransferase [Uliginosibacterium sp. H3]